MTDTLYDFEEEINEKILEYVFKTDEYKIKYHLKELNIYQIEN